MITIDDAIKSRITTNLQTIAGNNNPTMQTIVSRPRTPIFDKKFWQETIVQEATTATCTSVAIRKMTGGSPDRVYASFVTSTGTLIIKSAAIRYPIKNMAWTVEMTAPNCVACALEFDGRFVHGGLNVEYRTDSLPWVFYTNTAGELWGGILGGTFEILAASGTSAIDVVRGICSLYKDMDQGLIVFYIQDNAVSYRQLIAGTWAGQETVSIAPANPVAIKVERLFDYRICLHVTDSAGALWEIFTKMEASGWNGTEYISASLSSQTELVRVYYRDFDGGEEYIAAGLSAASEILYALSPVLASAENINDGTGNYGIQVLAYFDERIFNESGSGAAFTLSDEFGGSFPSTAVEMINDRTLKVTFIDFNNLNGTATLTYTPGTLNGEVIAVSSCSLEFMPIGLIPTEVEPPALVSCANIQYSEVFP